LPEPLAVLAVHAACALEQSIQHLVLASDQNLGHLERQAAHNVRELLRQTVERGAQAKSDATPPHCPVCGQPLTRLAAGNPRTFTTRFGDITVQRARGYCKRCRKWRVPADAALGLEETAGYSPAVQDMAALLASKMPARTLAPCSNTSPASSFPAPRWIAKPAARGNAPKPCACNWINRPPPKRNSPS
jgi:ribosomal protein L34E